MNLVSDRRANLALHGVIIAGAVAALSAISYARYMDQRADATAREGVTLAGILEMKARVASTRRTGVPATYATDPAPLEDAQHDADATPTEEPEPSESESLGEAAIFEALAAPAGTMILRE